MSINKEIEGTHLIKRVALIIYLKSVSDQYKLRRYGDIVYFSKKMKYCVLYVSRRDAKEIQREIASLDFEKQIADMAKEAEEKLQLEQEKNEDQIQ